MTFYTYLYNDPKDQTPIYVGKGQKMRAWDHLKNAANPRLRHLIKKRVREGYEVNPIVNHEVDEETALIMEMFWIAMLGREDLGTGTLFNLTDGGDKPPRTKPGCNAGKPPWNKGKRTGPQSEETKAKRSDALRGERSPCFGIQRTEEAKAKMSASMKGKPWTAARRAAQEARKNAGDRS